MSFFYETVIPFNPMTPNRAPAYSFLDDSHTSNPLASTLASSYPLTDRVPLPNSSPTSTPMFDRQSSPPQTPADSSYQSSPTYSPNILLPISNQPHQRPNPFLIIPQQLSSSPLSTNISSASSLSDHSPVSSPNVSLNLIT